MARRRQPETLERRALIRLLALLGYTCMEISNKLDIAYPTALADAYGCRESRREAQFLLNEERLRLRLLVN